MESRCAPVTIWPLDPEPWTRLTTTLRRRRRSKTAHRSWSKSIATRTSTVCEQSAGPRRVATVAGPVWKAGRICRTGVWPWAKPRWLPTNCLHGMSSYCPGSFDKPNHRIEATGGIHGPSSVPSRYYPLLFWDDSTRWWARAGSSPPVSKVSSSQSWADATTFPSPHYEKTVTILERKYL